MFTMFQAFKLEWLILRYDSGSKEDTKRRLKEDQKKPLFQEDRVAHTNSDCNLEINQSQVPIRTFDVHHVPGLQIGAAYPVL